MEEHCGAILVAFTTFLCTGLSTGLRLDVLYGSCWCGL